VSDSASTLPPEWAHMAAVTGRPFAEGGAYSSDCYADWAECVALLRERGATLAGAEDVLRSKHMRWCLEGWDGEYGAATVEHFTRYLDTSPDARAMAGIAGADVPDLSPLIEAAQRAATRFACSLTAILDAIPDEPRFNGARLAVAAQINAASRAIDVRPMRAVLRAEGVAK